MSDADGISAAIAAKKKKATPPPPPASSNDQHAIKLQSGLAALTPRSAGTIVRGFAHAGSVTLISGAPKSGKSFLALDLCLSVAAGEPTWQGLEIVKPGPVLYVACEGHGGFWKRLLAVKRHRGWSADEFPRRFFLGTGRPALIRLDDLSRTYVPHPDDVLEAIDRLRRDYDCAPVLVVIDTIFRSIGTGNVSASDQMNAYLAALDTICAQGAATAAIHHDTKNGASPAGSVALLGGADTIVRVRRGTDGAPHSWEVEMSKDDAESEPRAFRLPVVEIGMDPEGYPASSCVIEAVGEPVPAEPRESTKRSRNCQRRLPWR